MSDDRKSNLVQHSPIHKTHDAPVIPAPPKAHNELAETFPQNIPKILPIILGTDGHAYGLFRGAGGNPHAVRITGKFVKNTLKLLALQDGIKLNRAMMSDVVDSLQNYAETTAERMHVWLRSAPIEGGVELDVGDDAHTRIRITANNVETITDKSETLFTRTPIMQAFPIPAETGDIGLLDRYLNLDPPSVILLIAWITYTLAHPKVATTNYVFLVLMGEQGSGKSFMCRIVQILTDPSRVGVRILPDRKKDLAIATQNSHVLFFDNMRRIRQLISDALCMASTGGALADRQLFTDDEQHVLNIHGAMVFNGMHGFVVEPDLVQRCLPLTLKPIDESKRKSELQFFSDFQNDLPKIFRAILTLTSNIFAHLPTVETTNPERMIEFSQWLAAMEKAHDVPAGVYQMAYSAALNESMQDALLDDPLAAAVVTVADQNSGGVWSGTPTKLLDELEAVVSKRMLYSREWPRNAIALSKRLTSLQAGLRRQGIDVTLTRGKHRNITITNLEAF